MFLHTLAIIAGFWLLLFICDSFLKTYRPWKARYVQWMELYGITMSFAYVRCYTTGLNRTFFKCVNCSKPLSRAWFGLGTVVGVLLLFVSVCLLVFTPFQALRASDPSQRVLAPVMPGVNLPWNEGAYYLLALVLCGIFHEAGHALAASVEQVRVNGFGVFLLFVYPGAFVDLHPDHLSVISFKRQLRIYCAGVWHNVVLAVVAGLVIFSLPWLLCPLYASGEGAAVVSVRKDGPLVDKLVPGELITSLVGGGPCAVGGESQWVECIEKAGAESQSGFCVPNQLLDGHPSHLENRTAPEAEGRPVECCQRDSPSDICFRVMDGAEDNYKCLTARTVTSKRVCYHPRDCLGIGEHSCVFPAIPSASRLVRVAHSEGPDVLFLVTPGSSCTLFRSATTFPATLPFHCRSRSSFRHSAAMWYPSLVHWLFLTCSLHTPLMASGYWWPLWSFAWRGAYPTQTTERPCAPPFLSAAPCCFL